MKNYAYILLGTLLMAGAHYMGYPLPYGAAIACLLACGAVDAVVFWRKRQTQHEEEEL